MPALTPLLLPPAIYFPPANGRYTVTPSLYRLGTDFGNGTQDTRLFQIDRDFFRFRENKRRCRAERLAKYVCAANLPDTVREAASRLLAQRLADEYPALFSWTGKHKDAETLSCHLTGEQLTFDKQMRLAAVTGSVFFPAYADALDALCSQFPEDLALLCRDSASGEDRVAFLHLCAPSHWAGEEKIGRSWHATHLPVPGMERSRASADSLVRVMVEREPSVRFTWGIDFNDRLNQHPEPPPEPIAAKSEEPFFLRVERQVLWGMPGVNAALFTIRVYQTPARVIRADVDRREALIRALLSMSTESRRYKGLAGRFDAVLQFLCADTGSAGQ